MNKFKLIFLFFLQFFVSYGQNFEGFENFSVQNISSQPQTQWKAFNKLYNASMQPIDESNLLRSWQIINAAGNVIDTKSAYINTEDIGQNNTVHNWMISKQIQVPQNSQLTFYTKTLTLGDQGSKFKVYYSTNPDPLNTSSYILIGDWTETTLNTQYNIFEKKTVDITTSTGSFIPANTPVYIAFVRENLQQSIGISGDRWIIDNFDVVEKCMSPTNLSSNSPTCDGGTLTWSYTGSFLNFELEIIESGQAPSGVPTNVGITGNSFIATGLLEDTSYKFYIRTQCTQDNYSTWAGPFNFLTKVCGESCSNPIAITTLPYSHTTNSIYYGDTIDINQGNSCGTTPATTNYLTGNDVFYEFVADSTGMIDITLIPTGSTDTRSSIFVYPSCTITSNACLAGAANTGYDPRLISNFNVVAGQSYIILVSSMSTTQTFNYTLLIQKKVCDTPQNVVLSDPTTNGITVTWNNPSNTPTTQYNIIVQAPNQGIPNIIGQYFTNADGSMSYTITDLNPAIKYEIWVRTVCNDVPIGDPTMEFSPWTNPIVFNTKICDESDKCTYIIRTRDSANNGWSGNRMQIYQNGILLPVTFNGNPVNNSLIGNNTTGNAPQDFHVQICENVPFELVWTTSGTNPQQCIVEIINSFNQTVYTKAAGVSAPGQTVYIGTGNCTTPECNIAPTNVSIVADSITTIGATIDWYAPATESYGWDLYVVTAGSPAPTSTTTPTYSGVMVKPFTIPNALNPAFNMLADTNYDVYVRVICLSEGGASAWSVPVTFQTLPTCPKPTNLGVPLASITTTSAVLNWTNGSNIDDTWDILLIPGLSLTPPTGIPNIADGIFFNDVQPTGSTFTVNTLTPATIYYYYIRSVCPGDDNSTWAGPFVFNTVTCDDADKCAYKFFPGTVAGTGNWGTTRMEVRQNGIPIQVIGASGINNANGITVMLCNNVSVELVWTVLGNNFDKATISVHNPYSDIIYTKPSEVQELGLLYQTTVDCSAPSCMKPTNLQVTNITQTNATLSWTENNTPEATQWEIYVVPIGSPLPVNGTPVNPVDTPNYFIANTNPFTLPENSLEAGKGYIYYVRAICSETDTSTWTIVHPKTFITKPVNDECEFATPIPVNPTRECVNFVTGNTYGATRTLPNPPNTCPGQNDDDIWFSFVATHNIHIINITNVVGINVDITHALYSGDECGNLSLVYCSNPDLSVATPLTIGTLYKIRVYSSSGNVTHSVKFDICVTSVENITNDNCPDAITLPVNATPLCVEPTPASTTGATESNTGSNNCTGTENDDVWFEFTATSNKHLVRITDVVGTTNDVNFSLYRGTCENLIYVSCNVDNETVLNNLIIGELYKIRIFSVTSTVRQDVRFNICIGTIGPPVIANTTTYTKLQLIEDILLKSKCASVSNITWSTGTNFGNNPNGIGYFNSNESGFPFQEGIVLSTGNALNISGPNNTILNDGDMFTWPGDDELEAIILEGTGTPMNSYNATTLEFDFIPISDKISFNFLFASDEYGTFQCSYSDSFAFILTNNTTQEKKNLAIIPDVTPEIPVSVVTIRKQLFNAGCSDVNPTFFGEYYGNPNGITNEAAPINFNGLTKKMTAQSNVIPGQSYHIKMVIADRSDGGYDSAVFLEGGSFDLGDPDLGMNYLIEEGNGLCIGDELTIQLDETSINPALFEITWYKDGVLIPGENSTSLIINDSGTYTIKMTYIGTDCLKTGSIVVEYFVDDEPGEPLDLKVCTEEEFGVFDLTENTPVIMQPYEVGTHTITYFTTEEDAKNNVIENAITDLTEFVGINGQTIYVRIENIDTTCEQFTEFTLIVNHPNPIFSLVGNKEICPEESTTISLITILAVVPEGTFTFKWYKDGVLIDQPNTSSMDIVGEDGYGDYEIIVTHEGCTYNYTFTISNSNKNWNVSLTGTEKLCSNEEGVLNVEVLNNTDNHPITYHYTMPDETFVISTNPSITVDQIGQYTVSVKILGCESQDYIFNIIDSDATWNINFNQDSYSICGNQTTQIAFTPLNFDISNPDLILTWTSPTGIISNGPTVNANEIGEYQLTIDILGCSSTYVVEVKEQDFILAYEFEQGCVGNQYQLTIIPKNNSFNPSDYTYTWNGGNNNIINNPTLVNGVILKSSGEYSVTLTSADGCKFETDIVNIPSIGCQIQRGISPDGNGENDNFDLSLYNVKDLKIYNRYGTEIYSFGQGYTNQWHGQSSGGKELPNGTYFYVFTTLEGQTISDWIYINRTK